MTSKAQDKPTQDEPQDEPQATPDGFEDGWIDPTDAQAVADFIDAHGIEEFQRVRLAQTGTTYGLA